MNSEHATGLVEEWTDILHHRTRETRKGKVTEVPNKLLTIEIIPKNTQRK